MSDFSLRTFLPRFIAGLAALGLLGIVVGFVIWWSGIVSFAATQGHSAWFYAIVHNAFKNSVAYHSNDIEAPDDLEDPARIALGAQHYTQNCTKCHGAPGIGQNPQVLTMNPAPQHLPAVVDQFTDAELFYILDKGVMMSAMPAWPGVAHDDEIWSTVAFIRRLDTMTSDEYLALIEPEATDAPRIPFGDDVNAADMAHYIDQYPEDEYWAAAPASAFSDYAKAGNVIQQCAACHSANGTGTATLGMAPNLSVHAPEYITAALEAYATGERKSGIMQLASTGLSQDQREALGAYFSGQEAQPYQDVALAAADEEVIEAGRVLAMEGRNLDNIPACLTCHGNTDATSSAGMMIPALMGQSQPYIESQLRYFRDDLRGSVAPWNPMYGVAENLTDADIVAVSSYLALQAPTGEDVQPAIEVDTAAAEGWVDRVCKECHQADLVGSPDGEAPNLTLHRGEYVLRKLYDFHTGRRQNSQMNQTAQDMEPEELEIMAAYIGSLEPQPTRQREPEGDPAAGEEIAVNGLPDRGVQACLTCHGPESLLAIGQIPRLHGQHHVYLAERLAHFDGPRADEINEINPMPEIASELTAQEKLDVAAWFATQPILPKEAAMREGLTTESVEGSADRVIDDASDEELSPEGPEDLDLDQ